MSVLLDIAKDEELIHQCTGEWAVTVLDPVDSARMPCVVAGPMNGAQRASDPENSILFEVVSLQTALAAQLVKVLEPGRRSPGEYRSFLNAYTTPYALRTFVVLALLADDCDEAGEPVNTFGVSTVGPYDPNDDVEDRKDSGRAKR
jgi:hypothetical protein